MENLLRSIVFIFVVQFLYVFYDMPVSGAVVFVLRTFGNESVFQKWNPVCPVFIIVSRYGSHCFGSGLHRDHEDFFCSAGISGRFVVWNIWQYIFAAFSWNNTSDHVGR